MNERLFYRNFSTKTVTALGIACVGGALLAGCGNRPYTPEEIIDKTTVTASSGDTAVEMVCDTAKDLAEKNGYDANKVQGCVAEAQQLQNDICEQADRKKCHLRPGDIARVAIYKDGRWIGVDATPKPKSLS